MWVNISDRPPASYGTYQCKNTKTGRVSLNKYSESPRCIFRTYRHKFYQWWDASQPATPSTGGGVWVKEPTSIMQTKIGMLEVNCFDEDSEMSIRVNNSKYQTLSVDEAKELVFFIRSHIQNETEANPPSDESPSSRIEELEREVERLKGIMESDLKRQCRLNKPGLSETEQQEAWNNFKSTHKL